MSHRALGWLVAAVVLAVALNARSLVRSGRAFEPRPYVIAAVMVDLQVLLGAAMYVRDQVWEATDVVSSWVHPGVGVLALLVTHVTLRRARQERMAAAAYAVASRGLLAATLLVAVAIALTTTG